MRIRWLAILTLVAAFGLVTPSLMADHGRGEGGGHDHGKHFDDEHHGRGDRDDGWERRGGYEYRMYGEREGRPRGWRRGYKTGWRNCGLPPGQAKKYGCYTYVHEGRRYYYYQDDGGRVFFRRPTVHVFAGVDIVQ